MLSSIPKQTKSYYQLTLWELPSFSVSFSWSWRVSFVFVNGSYREINWKVLDCFIPSRLFLCSLYHTFLLFFFLSFCFSFFYFFYSNFFFRLTLAWLFLSFFLSFSKTIFFLGVFWNLFFFLGYLQFFYFGKEHTRLHFLSRRKEGRKGFRHLL